MGHQSPRVVDAKKSGPARFHLMGIRLLDRVTTAAEACSRQLSRACRRLRSHSGRSKAFLLSRRTRAIPFLSRKRDTSEETDQEERRSRIGSETTEEEEEEEVEVVWRRTIMMGEKCQPLDFSGVIYYDADGRQLSEVPTPRSPLRTPLRPSSASSSSSSSHLAITDRSARN